MLEHGFSIGGTEWVIIIFVGLILILGTGRLPGAARRIGRAVSEYNKAKSGIEEHVRGVQEEVGQFPKISGPVESEREKLETIARSAGISPDGKSDDRLREAISQKMGQKAGKGQERAGAAGSGEQAPAPSETTPSETTPSSSPSSEASQPAATTQNGATRPDAG